MCLATRLTCFAAAVFLAASGLAQDNGAESKPPAAEGSRPPPNWGFPRPEKRLPELPESTFRSSVSELFSRPAIRLPMPIGFEKNSGRLISVEVILAETPVVGNGKEMSVEKIAELEKAGKLISQSRYWVSLVENQPSELQFGERVPVVLGRTNFGGRAAQESVGLENAGTKLSLLGRIDGDSVLVKLELEQSRLIPSPAKAEGDAADAVSRPRVATTTYQSTLTIPPGKTVIAGGKEVQGDQGRVQTWLLVSATAEGAKAEGAKPEAGDDGSQTKIFRMLNARPEAMAKAMLEIFGKDAIQIGVDTRTNSLIVRGDAKDLDTIQAIIRSLDEPFEEKK